MGSGDHSFLIEVLGGGGILIYLILICLIPLLLLLYLYAAIFSVIPWLLSVLMILYGVMFIAYGAVGLLSSVTDIEGTGAVSHLLPQLGAEARLGIHIALLIIIGPALLIGGKRIYGPAKRLSLRSLRRVASSFLGLWD